MGDSPTFQPNNDDNSSQSGGIVVIAQGLTADPIEISFPEMKTSDTLNVNVIAESGAILHEVKDSGPEMDFSELSLPDGINRLVVWAGDKMKEMII